MSTTITSMSEPKPSRIEGWLEYLRTRHVTFSHSVHARADTALGTAAAEKMPAHELAKTVMYFGNDGFGLAVVPADRHVDLGAVRKALALTSARLASAVELVRLFPDCEPGAMPPFAEDGNMPVIVDNELVAKYIAFAIGTHRDIVRMTFADFRKLAEPVIASIARTDG